MKKQQAKEPAQGSDKENAAEEQTSGDILADKEDDDVIF